MFHVAFAEKQPVFLPYPPVPVNLRKFGEQSDVSSNVGATGNSVSDFENIGVQKLDGFVKSRNRVF